MSVHYKNIRSKYSIYYQFNNKSIRPSPCFKYLYKKAYIYNYIFIHSLGGS